jgi:hypothetical protein
MSAASRICEEKRKAREVIALRVHCETLAQAAPEIDAGNFTVDDPLHVDD